jgi:hypothetical protein
VPIAVVAAGWLVRELLRRRAGAGLKPVPIAVPAGTAVAARSAFAGPVTVTAPAAVLDSGPAAVPPALAVPAAASADDSVSAGVGAFLPLGYP